MTTIALPWHTVYAMEELLLSPWRLNLHQCQGYCSNCMFLVKLYVKGKALSGIQVFFSHKHQGPFHGLIRSDFN